MPNFSPAKIKTAIGASVALIFIATTPIVSLAQSAHLPPGGKIVIGSAMALSHGSDYDGVSRKNAMEALVKSVNASGGVNGRMLELIVHDDAHDPKKDVEIAKKLIENENAFVLLNFLGTATSSAVTPLIIKTGALYFGPITGADIVRVPFRPSIFNVRGSFTEEVEALVRSTIDKSGIKDIGMFYRDDAFGRSGKTALFSALSRRSIKPAGFGKHESESTDITAGLKELLKTKPPVVMLWTNPPVAINFIKQALAKGYSPLYLAPSSISADQIVKDPDLKNVEVLLASGYPRVSGSTLSIVRQFRSAMNSAGFKEADVNDKAFEGYVNSVILVEGIKGAGKDLSRDSLISSLEKMTNFNLGGLTVTFGPENHQAFKKIYLVRVKGGSIEQVE
jgi:branched-chain amino acid transport system substrate-binding protein